MDKKLLQLVNDLLCSLKILDKKVNKLEDCCEKEPIEKTSDLINDGESGDSYFIEETELTETLSKYELIENKQNSLEVDGTGTKYPTVDAVNEAIGTIISSIQPIEHYFSNSIQETVIHNLGRYPNIIVLEGTEVIIPNSIEHTPDMNSVTVTFNPETTGLIIIH